MTYEEFTKRVERVRAEIASAAEACGRLASEVKLMAVTKTHGPWAPEFAARAGIHSVGENRVQEAVEKMPLCKESPPWELIGHLQSNKAKLAAKHFARIQSVDSEKLLRLLDRAAAEESRVLPVLLQINAGNDPAKFGLEMEDTPALLERALQCPNLNVEGLMTIAPLSDDPSVAQRTFANLRELRDRLASQFQVPLSELSMGMSGDLAHAIQEGSTLVRVGTALFGAR